MRRKLVLILVLIVWISMLVIPVSANGVPPRPYFRFTFSDLPEETAYVDLLIKLSTKDAAYVPLVVENLPEGMAEDAEIIEYGENNYRSYTFHYKTALSMIQLSDDGCVYFFTDNPVEHSDSDHEEDIQKRGNIRLAMLDKAGNILHISKPLSLKANSLFEYILGEFHYNAKEDTLEVISGGASLGMIMFYPLLSIVGIIVTCVLERLTAWPFGLGKHYGRMIWATNMVSQILMRIIYIPLYAIVFRQYWNAVIFLELLIYAGELMFYFWKMNGVSRMRILLYTVAANSLSLINSLVFYRLFI